MTHTFVRVSAAVLGSTALAVSFSASARAATIAQPISGSLDFSTPFDLVEVVDLSSFSFNSFDTSLGSLNSVSVGGAIAGSYMGQCFLPSCSAFVGAALDLSSPVAFSVADGFVFDTGSDPGADAFSFAGSVEIAPPLPLAVFEGAGEPLFAPLDGTLEIGILPSPGLTGTAALTYDLALVYDFEPVPEPATTTGLLIAGGMGLLAKRKKSAASAAKDESN